MSAQSKPPTVFEELRIRLERSRQRDYQRKRDSCRRPSTPNPKPAVSILTTTTATTTATTNQFEYLARKPWASITPPATHSSPPAEHSPRYSATSSPLYRPRSPSPLQHSPRYSPNSPQLYSSESSTANRVSPSSSTTSTPPRHPAGLLFSAKNDIDLQDYEPENIGRRLPSPYTASSTVHSSPRLGSYDPAAGYSTPARPATSTVAVLSPVPARRLSPQKRYSSIHNSPIHPILAQRTPLLGHVLPPIDPRRASLAPPSISPHPLSLYHSSSSTLSTASTSSPRSRPVRPLPSRFAVAAESRSPVIRALRQRLPPIAHLLEHVVDEPKSIFRPAINPMWGSYTHQPASSRGQKRRHSELDVDLEVEDYGRHGACTRASDCDCNGRRVRKRRYVVIVEEHCPCASDEDHHYPAPTHSRLPRLPSLSSTISSSGSISQLVTPLSTPEAGSSVEHPICVEDDKAAAGPLPVKRIKRPVF